jgi:hypothetical protein
MHGAVTHDVIYLYQLEKFDLCRNIQSHQASHRRITYLYVVLDEAFYPQLRRFYPSLGNQIRYISARSVTMIKASGLVKLQHC